MTHGAGISPPDRRRGNGQRLRALWLLLALCLAVVPHVTLAATAMRTPAATATHRHDAASHAAPAAMKRADNETAPCHRPRHSREHPAAMPSCCAIGCGLIAAVPAIALPSRALRGSPPAPARAEPLSGLSPEPAKPPPRAASAQS